jgi:ATP/maltotriose-dependent transcriptional regulator MalT
MRFQPIVHIDDAIWRERLITRMLGAPPSTARLTVVTAPPGYGKTTVLAQLARRAHEQGSKVVWMNCDTRDAHPEIFAENFLIALGQCHLSTATDAAMDDPVAAYVAKIAEPLLICIDEYETASSALVDDIIASIAMAAPPSVSIVLASRETPHLQLTQLQLAGRVRLIDADFLRFSHDETQALLKDLMPARAVEQIAAYADGWPFALQLARLRAAGGVTEDWAFNSQAKMPRRQIFDYLAEEVFSTLSQTTIEFLSDVAVLEIVDVASANAARQHNNSLAFIQELSALRPIVVVDESSWSARLHPLLRDYLLHMMKVSAPGRVEALHLRAAEHFASQQCVYEAVCHAIAGDRFDMAARLIEEAGAIRLLLSEGELRVRLLLQQLPAVVVQQRPRLRLLKIGQQALERTISGTATEFARVEQLVNESDADCDDAMLRPDMELTRCTVFLEDSEHTLHFSPWATLRRINEQGRSRIAQDPLFRGLSLPIEISLLNRYGPVDRCERYTVEMEKIYSSVKALNTSPWIWMYHARTAFARGDLNRCEQTIEMSLKRDVNFVKFRQNSLGQLVAVMLGKTLYQRGDLGGALAHFSSVTSSRPVTLLEVLVGAYVDCALCEFGLGNSGRAIELLNSARDLAFEENLPHLGIVAAATLIELEVKLGQPQKAENLAATMALDMHWDSAQTAFAFPWVSVEALAKARYFLQIQRGAAQNALETAITLQQMSIQAGYRLGEVAAQTMQAHALSLLGQSAASDLNLRSALLLAQECGAKQVFVGMFPESMPQIRVIAISHASPCKPWAEQVLQLWESAFLVRSNASNYFNAFTQRELDVLSELAKDQTTKMIARTIMRSPETVKYYLKSIFSKLGVSTREDAVTEARRRVLIP